MDRVTKKSSAAEVEMFGEGNKYFEVKQWLDSIIKPIHKTQYEINEETFPIYEALMRQNMQRNADIGEVITKLYSNGVEYELEVKRYRTLIQRCGVNPDTIDSDIQLLLHSLAEISLILDLKTPTETDFLFAVDSLKETQMNLESEICQENKIIKKLQKKTKSALQRAYELQMILDVSDAAFSHHEEETQKMTRKADFLPKKLAEYENIYEKFDVQLKESGLTNEIRHEMLLEKNKELTKLDVEINSIKSTLNAFCSLPPDIPSSQVKVNEAKLELAAIEERLREKMTEL